MFTPLGLPIMNVVKTLIISYKKGFVLTNPFYLIVLTS